MSWVEITREPARTLLHPPKRYCLYFDGEDDYVEVADDPSLRWGYDPFTIELWVNLPEKNNHQGILRKHTLTQGYFNIFFNYVYRQFQVETRSSDTNELIGCYSFLVEWGTWNQAVFVREDPYLTWFTNGGNPRTFEDTRSGREFNYAEIILGFERDTWMLGSFAILRIYNRALSDSEIQHNYLNPMNPILDGLVLWLSLEEGSGTTAHDESGNGNDGTIHGARWIEVTRLPAR